MTDTSQGYISVDPFVVDEGELATVGPVQAFTLGVEWEMVRTIAKTGDVIHTRPIHTDNRRRIEGLLSRYGYHQSWEAGDDWSFVTASCAAPDEGDAAP